MTFYNLVRDRTMMTKERLFDVYNSARFAASSIDGDIVEIGTWRGGCLALAGLTLDKYQPTKGVKKIFGYDTFEGHPMPSTVDTDVWGQPQLERYHQHASKGERWGYADYDEANDFFNKLFARKLEYSLTKGLIENSPPLDPSQKFSLIRIDVDWYEPTLFALRKFYPLLSEGGILILDDYGHYSGCKQAVDEYFGEKPPKMTYIDYSCVSIQKFTIQN